MTAHAVTRALQATCLGLGAALVIMYFNARPLAPDDRERPVHRFEVVRAAGAAELTIMRHHRLRARACDQSDPATCRDEAPVPVIARSASVR